MADFDAGPRQTVRAHRTQFLTLSDFKMDLGLPRVSLTDELRQTQGLTANLLSGLKGNLFPG